MSSSSISFERDSQGAIRDFRNRCLSTEKTGVGRRGQKVACPRVLRVSILNYRGEPWDTVGAIAGGRVLQIGQLHTKVIIGVGLGELEDRRLAADLGGKP